MGAALGAFAQSQTGNLQGKVLDEKGMGIPYVTIRIYQGENLITGTASDVDGKYNFSNLDAGEYDILVTHLDYQDQKIAGLEIGIGKTVFHDVTLKVPEEGGQQIGPAVVYYEKPIVDPIPGGKTTISSEDIENMAIRDVGDFTQLSVDVKAADDGEAPSSNGSRPTFNDIYVDGVRVFGPIAIPDREIEQIQIITSGVPAEFGDANGAITNIITKGAPSAIAGGAQLETSQYLDAFGATTLDFSLGGPIWLRTMTNAEGDTLRDFDGNIKRRSILGYRFSARYQTTKDSRPSALGSFQLSDDKLAELMANPLLANTDGTGSILNMETITEDDLVYTKVRPNARQSSGLFTGRLDFSPSPEYKVNLGGQGEFNWGHTPTAANRLVNSAYNPYSQNSSIRVYGRFRHVVLATQFNPLIDSTAVPSVFQNLSYEIQADFTRNDNLSYDERFGENFWEYGYAGEIRRSLRPVIGVVDTNYVMNSMGDTLATEAVFGHAFNQIVFDGYTSAEDLGYDPGLSRYNNFVDFASIGDMELMEVVNGRFTTSSSSFFGLHNNIFATNNGYQKGNSSQFRTNVKANFDLYFAKSGIRHSIQVGGTYEQRVFRSYNLNPFELWTLADQSANNHISNAADVNSPVLDADGNAQLFFDPLTQRYYTQNQSLIRVNEDGTPTEMSAFAENLREALAKDPSDWVNVHEMKPGEMNMAWFEPTTLIQGSQQLVNYYGYDYLGNQVGTSTSFNDFFNDVDENGRKTRPVAPFAPIYAAGYIQDNFRYNDMLFNIGIRVDHYDANTKVLRDPYSVTGYYTASEFENAESGYLAAQRGDYQRPTNIGDDYAVYVNENSQDATVVGYRDGEQWYDRTGNPVNSPTDLGTIILPALRGFSTAETDPQGENYDPDAAFRDYDPSVVFMPRISFAFPIGNMANFFANYDVLSMRPSEATLATPLTYFNFRENADLMANPNLRPQRTINYVVGYEQALTEHSRVKFSLMYREERDLIQARQYILAYPISYTSFGNDDFSTVKAFNVEYELRRSRKTTNKLRVLANYSLQFAEGTGSSPTSSLAVAAEELKYIFPLDFDQRHTFFLMLDYRYKGGSEYDGPVWKGLNLLANTGANLSFNLSSGTPYTKKEIPGGLGTGFNATATDGSINGARLPWNFRVNLRINRDIIIGAKSKNPLKMNVYLRVQNLFNTQNVLNVYPATGSPVDDGFLTMENSPGLGVLASRPEAYQMLYDLRMRNPFNISRPRRIFLGASVSF
jgi:hypothetical protein